MKNYHLVPDVDRWKIEREDGGTIKYLHSREQAVKRCAEYMGNHHGSLKIHRPDGTIEEERTYPRSADPVESPG